MHRTERHRYILDQLRLTQRVSLTRLSQDLRVSDDTLRRDLADLAQAGLLTKIHGGAVVKSGLPLGFTDRLGAESTPKLQLAAKALPLLQAGQVVLLDGGTTNLALARQLPLDLALTVVTNSFPVVQALLGHPLVEVAFLGGTVFKASQVTLGLSALQMLLTVQPDWLVLGVSNVHPQRGITAPDREEAALKRQMVAQAQRVMILADTPKLHTAEPYQVASLRQVEAFVVQDDQVAAVRRDWPAYAFTVY